MTPTTPSHWRRLGAAIIDLAIVLGLVVAAFSYSLPPPIGFMGDYQGEDHSAYWIMVARIWGSAAALSLLAHLTLSVTIGQWIFGLFLAPADEDRLGGAGGARRRFVVWALRQGPSVLIYAAGPLLGLAFGPAANLFSSAVLAIGLIIWPASWLGQAPLRLSHSRLLIRPS